MADACRHSRQFLGMVILGERDITVRDLTAICRKALKTDLHTFFGPLPKSRAA